jgi:proteasome lid subunit RPN8/RPN11
MRKHILKAIREHAAADYPREACGLLLQIGRRHVYRRCNNLADNPNDEFILDPADYAAAEDAGVIIGIVHSHPDATSRASPHDLALCEASALPWHILSWPEGDLNTIVPTGEVPPLVGRPFVHGVWDCYGIIRDWYALERGIELPNFTREDGWWNRGDDLYMRLYAEAGFEQVSGALQVGDVIVMQVLAEQSNHGAVYLGDGKFLHHLYGRLSERAVYGGYWQERTTLTLRYKGRAGDGHASD